MARKHPVWIRVLLRLAAHRASDAELGDVLEEYNAAGHGATWLIGQTLSIVRSQRSHLTLAERGAEMLSHLHNDIRYAFRTLARSPGFAVAAIAPIALGIGINTAIFSILNSVAWRSLPVPDADGLVSIYQDFRGGPRRTVNGARALFSIPEYRAYRDEAHTLSGLAAYSRRWTVTLGRETPTEIDGILVTCNYFAVLEVSPALGAGFTPDHCATANAPPVVILSHALWRSAFGGDPQVLHTQIVLNGRDVTVVGVAPSGFDGIDMAKAAFFAPTPMTVLLGGASTLHENAYVSWMTLVGRRRHGAEIAHVRADLATIANRIDQQQPGRVTSLIIEPAAALSLPPQRNNVLRAAAVVMAAFGFVLLIAAANVANILLARAADRRKEIAIRLSVGANRGRLIRQLLTESVIIAGAGALCGTLLFSWSFQALLPALLGTFDAEPMRIDAAPDRNVLWFALALTAITTLIFGLFPALHASRADLTTAIKQDGIGRGAGRGWMRGTFMAAQIALCTLLLIPAALLSRALYAAYQFDPGFDHRDVVMISIDLRGPRYENDSAGIFHDEWMTRVGSLPGVEQMATVTRMPLSPGRSQTTFRLGDESEGHVVDINAVSPDFFSLLAIPIARGRVFTDGEVDVALVTESTARRYWPGQDAVGRVIAMDGRRRQIVGVLRDAQVSQSREAMASYVYLPATRGAQRQISVLMRTRAGMGVDVAAAVRAETMRMDPSLVAKVRPLTANLAMLQALSEIAAVVAGMLGLLALGLATIGVYGVVGYVVSRRRPEVGVRMALGARAIDIERLLLRQTLQPVAIGTGVGVAVAATVAPLLRSALFGIAPNDAAAFIAAPGLVLAIAAGAALIPVRRALRMNPVTILRSE